MSTGSTSADDTSSSSLCLDTSSAFARGDTAKDSGAAAVSGTATVSEAATGSGDAAVSGAATGSAAASLVVADSSWLSAAVELVAMLSSMSSEASWNSASESLSLR